MKRLLSVLCILAVISSCSKKDHTIIQPAPAVLPDTLSAGWSKLVFHGSGFNDIFFIDNNVGYATGVGIYKSTNGGVSWTRLSAMPVNGENIGAFGNSLCATSFDQTPYRSQDGGVNFQTNGVGSGPASDCFYTSASVCFLTGPYQISKSTDGGQTFPFTQPFTDNSEYSSLFFLNSTTGWNIRTTGIYKTTDAGATWTLLHTISGLPSAVDFLDNSNGYYSSYDSYGNSAVYKTVNGGATWTLVFQTGNSNFNDIAFVSVNEGYVSAGKRIFKTTDAGSTWNVVAALGNASVTEIHFTDAAHGWASDSDSTILRFQ